MKATFRSYIAEGLLWVLTIAAMSVSYWTQYNQVLALHMANWESLIWAGSTDFGALVGLFLARDFIKRGIPTFGAWIITILCSILSIQFNITGTSWREIEVHAWMPTLVLISWYFMLHGRHVKWLRRSPDDRLHEHDDRLHEHDDRLHEHDDLPNEQSARELIANALERDRELEAKELAALIGRSVSHTRRLLREHRTIVVERNGRQND